MSWKQDGAGVWAWEHERGKEPAAPIELPPGWLLGGSHEQPQAVRSMEGEALWVTVGHPYANMLRGPPGERRVLALRLPWVCDRDLFALCRHADEAFEQGAFSVTVRRQP